MKYEVRSGLARATDEAPIPKVHRLRTEDTTASCAGRVGRDRRSPVMNPGARVVR